jgi:hypothetical protein
MEKKLMFKENSTHVGTGKKLVKTHILPSYQYYILEPVIVTEVTRMKCTGKKLGVHLL